MPTFEVNLSLIILFVLRKTNECGQLHQKYAGSLDWPFVGFLTDDIENLVHLIYVKRERNDHKAGTIAIRFDRVGAGWL